MIILGVHDRSDVFCDLSVICDPGVWYSCHMLVCFLVVRKVYRECCVVVRYILNINILSVLIFHACLVQQNVMLFGI